MRIHEPVLSPEPLPPHPPKYLRMRTSWEIKAHVHVGRLNLSRSDC